jgi:hypothetical protein
MEGPRQEGIGWRDLPRERQRRLVVLVGKLIRQRLTAAAPADAEAADERDPAECRPAAAPGQDPDPTP